ncbi:MAG: hypothetical protein HZA51_14595 [Planctomycetes bacterium]|nr:hypothetical protein [Planctomycetota bacterium]
MRKKLTAMALACTLSTLAFGCSRMFKEGMGSKGASGRVSDPHSSLALSNYKGMTINELTIANGVDVPSGMSSMIRNDMLAIADRRGLDRNGHPGLTLSGEIVHYESDSKLDAVVSPFQEVIVRTRLTDTQSGDVVQETNLTGRAKASSSSGDKSLSAAVAKALNTWLKNGGVAKNGESDNE